MIQKFEEFINESAESNQFKKALVKYGASKEIFWDGSEMRIYPKEYTEISNEQYPCVRIESWGDGFVFLDTDKGLKDPTFNVILDDKEFVSGTSKTITPCHTFDRLENDVYIFNDANAKKIMDAIKGAETLKNNR
jgi:hypothetical protein